MRRSAAPSQIGSLSKRPRFQVPATSSQSEAREDADHGASGRSTRDVLSLLTKSTKSKKKVKKPFASPAALKHGPHTSENKAFPFIPNNSTLSPKSETSTHSQETESNTPNHAVGDKKQTETDSSTCDVASDVLSPNKKNNLIVSQKKLNFKAFKIPTASLTALTGSASTELRVNGARTSTDHHENDESGDVTRYFSVMWCKLSKKKHKTWEGDAILVAKGRSLTLLDLEGKEIGRSRGYKASELAGLQEGTTLCIGSREIEVMGTLSEAAFKTGKCFTPASSPAPAAPAQRTGTEKPFVKPMKAGEASHSVASPSLPVIKPRHDPAAPNALVLPRPTQSQVWECGKKGGRVVDVVVDPYLSQHLRPHQRHGVVFLYQCIMGMKDYGGQGAILADEMGLGKTLQCISLIWTLLKQGPYNGKPVAKKVLVITPGSLVKNWVLEFKKWLGTERLKVYAVGPDSKMEEFVHLPHHPVMIISYEMFVRTIESIRQVNFDLIVCDEGHRLKNTNIKTTTLVQSLPPRRRIVLTGTPVQNDLQELYSIVNFCNPAVLGSAAAFRRVYEEPIVASRQPDASDDALALGRERAAELNRITSMFILRRTSDINNKYLPPKVELVLFCTPSNLQLQLYRQLLSSPALRSCVRSSDTGQHLMCISALKKLCNHPVLLHESAVRAGAEEDGHFNTECDLYKHLLEHYPITFDLDRPISADSGKLSVVENMLQDLHESSSREKVVLVSNYTQTLNVLSTLCRCKGYAFLRLDGQTPTSKRQQLVERFNSTYSNELVFLLSSKAGGVGLNLIGASRLVLFDIDWNPANDLQAMARVWRDGQKKTVYIYRLLTRGTIEEKMYQRQITKQSLSGVVVDAKHSNKLCFSPEELRDLFTLQENTPCATHALLECRCTEGVDKKSGAKGMDCKPSSSRKCQLGVVNKSSKNACMDELMDWCHVSGPKPDLSAVDPLLRAESFAAVSFVFYNECNQQLKTSDDS